MSCPGPHLMCAGCRASKRVPAWRLYDGTQRATYQILSTRTCPHCRGIGFFCKADPSCGGTEEVTREVVLPPA